MADRKDPLAGTQYAHQDQIPPQYQGGAAAGPAQPHQSYYNADAIVPQQTGHSELPGSPAPPISHADSYTSYTHTPATQAQAQDAGGYYASQQATHFPQQGAALYQSPQSTGQHSYQGPTQAYEMHPQQTQSHQEHYGQAQKPGAYQQPQQPQQPQQVYNTQQGHGAPQGQPGTYAAANTQNHPPGYEKYRNATPLNNLTSGSAPVDCPNCRQRTMTHTKLESGNTTNAWAAGLCFLTCLGCIPYCISSTKDVVHNCGNCGAHLATWHRSGRTEVHMHG